MDQGFKGAAKKALGKKKGGFAGLLASVQEKDEQDKADLAEAQEEVFAGAQGGGLGAMRGRRGHQKTANLTDQDEELTDLQRRFNARPEILVLVPGTILVGLEDRFGDP